MKVRIHGYEVEGTPEEIRRLIGAPQGPINPYVAPSPPTVPVYPPYYPYVGDWQLPPVIYGTSTTYGELPCATASGAVQAPLTN